MDGARRAGRADAVASDQAVAGQHEDVVAERLEVVHHVIARNVPFVVQTRSFAIRLLRQVAAEAAWVPRRVAGDAAHVAVLMRTLLAADSLVGIGLAPPEQSAGIP